MTLDVIEPESVEALGEQRRLGEVALPQALGRQALLVEEVEDARRPVVARRVVRRAGEAHAAARVLGGAGLVRRVQLLELGEPARDRRAQLVGLRRQPQEAVALAELEVLVAAADDPGRSSPGRP